MRIDDPTLYNPFGWRLAELEDPAIDPGRRQALVEALLVCEAEELALGRRHVTIVHGDPDDLTTSLYLTAFYELLAAVAATAAWTRVRGTATHVTVTVGGDHADDVAEILLRAAERANPGSWDVTASAYPRFA